MKTILRLICRPAACNRFMIWARPGTALAFFILAVPALYNAQAADHRNNGAGIFIPVIDAYSGGGETDEAASEGNGIGGTGYKPGQGTNSSEGNGIGGTGQQASEGGTGGAGGIGGTGIIGAITGFGSIFVNGYEVEIPDDLGVTIKDGKTTASKLAIGQVVEIEASGDGSHVNAASVNVRHELGGRIKKIDPAKRSIIVLGQSVQYPDAGRANATPDNMAFETLKIGQRVDVSGFRREDGTIEATRLDPLPNGEPDHLIGTLKKNGTSLASVSGLSLAAGHTLNQAQLADGAEVRIVGQLQGRRFRARRIRARARHRFSNRVRRLAIEGYARRRNGGVYMLGRFRLNRPQAANRRARMIYTGRLDARRRFIQGNARPARLLTRRGLRIRAIRHNLRRNLRRNPAPGIGRKWQNAPPGARPHWQRKKKRKRWYRRRRRN